MKHFFQKIHVRIVTLFFILITLACLTLIMFNYYKNLEGTLDLSSQLIAAVSKDMIAKIDGVTQDANLAAEMTKGLLNQGEEVTSEKLVAFLLRILQKNPSISSINIATEEGQYLSVMNLLLGQNFKKFLQPPERTKYVIRLLTDPKKHQEEWLYLDTERKLVQKVEKNNGQYDFEKDPWYAEVKAWPTTYWQTSYLPRGAKPGEGEEAITISLPLYQEKKFQGIIAVNVALNTLSNFISHQKIGKQGRIFFLDEKGNVIVPLEENFDPETKEMVQSVIRPAFARYRQELADSSISEVDGKEYITYMTDFPLSFTTRWTVAVEVPLLDFTSGLIRIRRETMFLSVTVLILSAIWTHVLSGRISRPIKKLSKDVDRIKHFDFSETEPTYSHVEEIYSLESSLKAMRSALRSFGKYVPQEIVKTLIQRGEDLLLGSSRQQVAVFFSDIANFTTLVEQSPPHIFMPKLSAYFDIMSKIILNEQGTIDKYIGDSIMALWGAPKQIENPVVHACTAAIRCHRAGNLHQDPSMPPWQTRFGLHFGDVLVGNFGTKERMNYTAIGDVVNIASRLEGLNKEYHTSIIITSAVEAHLPNNFIRRPLDSITVKGKTEKTEVFELLGTKEDLPPESIELCSHFGKAYTLFHSSNKEAAKAQFLLIHTRFPNDWPTQLYLNKLDVV